MSYKEMYLKNCFQNIIDTNNNRKKSLDIKYGLTGVTRDIFYKIVLELDDRSLFNLSMVNKKLYIILNNDLLWLNKTIKNYSYLGSTRDIGMKYKGERSWKEYYIYLSTELRKYKDYMDGMLTESSGEGKNDLAVIALEKGANIHVKDDEGGILPIVKGIEYMCEDHREQLYQDFKHGIPFPS